MTNSPNDKQHNIVSFLRHNQPTPPKPHPDLEQRIMDSLEPQSIRRGKRYLKTTWTIPGAIATGFLFTSVSFALRTPRLAIEPKDLEYFLVKNWQDTLNNYNYPVMQETEAEWLLPSTYESQPALSVSAQ